MILTDEGYTFVNHLLADPHDKNTRLVFADWCQEHDEPQVADYLRKVRTHKFVRLVERYGEAAIFNHRITIPTVLAQFVSYYKSHPAWGVLHIVLDESNVEDATIRWVVSQSLVERDAEGRKLALYLLQMSRTQRLVLPARVRAAKRKGASA